MGWAVVGQQSISSIMVCIVHIVHSFLAAGPMGTAVQNVEEREKLKARKVKKTKALYSTTLQSIGVGKAR